MFSAAMLETSTPTRPIGRRGLSALLAVLLGLLLLLGSGALTPAVAETERSTDAYERRVQRQINQVRVAHDLPRLRLASCTDSAAERWTRHLDSTGKFYHQSMGDLLDRCDAVYAGETLGRGWMTPRRLVQMWMDSPPHRAVLLNPTSRRIGVGARFDASDRRVVTANFMRF
jgi:uncharacterized protein YkwD